jgi:alpha-L-rhamnosidase
MTLNVTIPPNTTATVVLPSADRAAITEGGRPLDQAEGVTFEKTEAGQTFVSVGSGQYSFNTPAP